MPAGSTDAAASASPSVRPGSAAAAVPTPMSCTGKRLDVAKSDIKRAGFEDKAEVLGGGTFGVLDESNWEVCEQAPAAGKPLTEAPRLTIERDCNKDDVKPSEEPSPEGTVSPTPSAEPTLTAATKITVDALLDKLNAANMGGIKLGDQFRLTGELFQSDLWGTGATGDYSVLLKAKGGAQDLMVFVNESDASGWQDGTMVELVVENVELTINGETTDGWLRAVSVKTLPGR